MVYKRSGGDEAVRLEKQMKILQRDDYVRNMLQVFAQLKCMEHLIDFLCMYLRDITGEGRRIVSKTVLPLIH